MSRDRQPTNPRAPRRRTGHRQSGDGAARVKRTRVKKLRILLVALGLMVLAGISTVFGLMMAVASDLPRLEDREQYKISKPSYLYDDQGKLITVLRNNQNRILISSNQISQTMKQAVVSVEDKRFYRHQGIDVRGIGRALVTDLTGIAPRQGASTITQQFVKNALVANDNRTVLEKLKEAALAYHLERKWSKDKILTEYLNTIYFGNGAYGIEAAAETYFGDYAHPGCVEARNCAAQLLPWEAAMLAGVIASPSGYDPVTEPKSALTRRNQVLSDMAAQGYITTQIYHQSKSHPVPTEIQINPPRESSASPYFSSWVRQELVDRYDAGITFGGGLKVHTTLDLNLQHAAEQAINNTLPFGGPSAALVAIDNQTGKIRAMVGGNDYQRRPFNLATQGHRQPGSSFKMFTLVAALQKGLGLGTPLLSQKITDKRDGTAIKNYENSYMGMTNMLNATIVSDNTAYVRLGWRVGLKRIAKTAYKMGIETPLSVNTAMVLGGLHNGVSPLEMAYAYSTLANYGRRAVGSLAPTDGGPVAIDHVDQHGKLYRNQRDHTRYKRVMSPYVAKQARLALSDVVSSGTGKKAAIGGFAAGKTGTTENYGDAWFVGFNDELTVAIWVGFPDKVIPMLTEFGGQPVAGGTYPALIWHDFMLSAMQVLQQETAAKKNGATGATGIEIPDSSSPAPGSGDTGGDTGGGGNQGDSAPKDKSPKQPSQPKTRPAPQPPAGGNGGEGGGVVAPG